LAVCAAALATTAPAVALWRVGAAAYKAGNYSVALIDFKQAAFRGNAMAQLYLGEMYREGKGVPQNYVKASKVV
ncbi:Sel1 repeat family, partial [mine drainage metagenome]